MAALTWSENLVPVPVSELQPYAASSLPSKPNETTCNPEKWACIMDFKPDKADTSYVLYLNRTFGFPHTSPDTMGDSDHETAYHMALWTRCPHCRIIFKNPDGYDKHKRKKTINSIQEYLCPQSPAFSEVERTQLLFNCTICEKNFDDSKRPPKQLKQHLITKKHMAKVNTELEHKEHERLCNLVGISVD